MFKQLALSALIVATALAPAMAADLNPQPEPPGRSIPMADGKFAILTSGGALMEKLNGKWSTLPAGKYQLKNGKLVTVEVTGVVTAASRAELNPQPLPP